MVAFCVGAIVRSVVTDGISNRFELSTGAAASAAGEWRRYSLPEAHRMHGDALSRSKAVRAVFNLGHKAFRFSISLTGIGPRQGG
jgi:hypothetical protein